MFWHHVGDEGKAFGLPRQAVNREVHLRQRTYKTQGGEWRTAGLSDSSTGVPKWRLVFSVFQQLI
uniref:Uncharacterized protein n=1 Tax=Anguilla anguilla TaxID=7936 RepID=A0A0E9SYF3_ANGAN